MTNNTSTNIASTNITSATDVLLVVEEVNDDGFPSVGHTDQHVCHGQTAHKEVHGRVQVLVLHDGSDHQNVLHQTDDAQNQEHLEREDSKTNCSMIRVVLLLTYQNFINTSLRSQVGSRRIHASSAEGIRTAHPLTSTAMLSCSQAFGLWREGGASVALP